jgi:hypothetical protein
MRPAQYSDEDIVAAGEELRTAGRRVTVFGIQKPWAAATLPAYAKPGTTTLKRNAPSRRRCRFTCTRI